MRHGKVHAPTPDMRDAYHALRFAPVAQAHRGAAVTVPSIMIAETWRAAREGSFFGHRGRNLQGGITEGSHALARDEDEMWRHSRVDVNVMLANLLVYVLVRKMGLFRVELE